MVHGVFLHVTPSRNPNASNDLSSEEPIAEHEVSHSAMEEKIGSAQAGINTFFQMLHKQLHW